MTWLSEVASNGRGRLFKVTQDPPSTVGSDPVPDAPPEARFFPLIEARAPGDRLASKLAWLTTPF